MYMYLRDWKNRHRPGFWNYQILLLGQNPLVPPRFICLKIDIFSFREENICCEYSLEPPPVLMNTHNIWKLYISFGYSLASAMKSKDK